MYYIKYNDIDLSQLVKVKEVSLPSLPEMEHASIDMWEMDGNIFNSSSFGNRTIEISALIQPLDPDDLEAYVNDVKRAFFSKEPRPLFIGDETKYLLAVPEGEVVVTELGKGTCDLNVTLVAYSPYWIGLDVQLAGFEGNTGEVANNGDVPTTPVITIGVGSDTTFYQIENTTTDERILLGEKPKTTKTTVKVGTKVLEDDCLSLDGWVNTTAANIDTGCGTGGTLGITSEGVGICISTFGSGSGTWKGAAYRKNLGTNLKDFGVKATFTFNSTGTNGDPTKIENYKYKDDISEGPNGPNPGKYVYKTRTTTVARKGPGTKYKKLTTYKPDTKIAGTPEKGWLKHTYDNKTAYTSMKHIKTIYEVSKTNDVVCNFVTNKATALRSSASEWSKSKCTIPAGTVIRCYVDEVMRTETTAEDAQVVGTGYRKLRALYKDKWGYVKIADMTRASEATHSVTYEIEGETADDKQGRLQVYGFSSTGTQLFSMSLIDDSEWYEATYPLIRKNGRDFLYDKDFKVPESKTKKVESNDTVKYENILSGRTKHWNNFEGELYIERKKDVWRAYVWDWLGKTIESKYVKDTSNSSEDLAYLVLYIGTVDDEKVSAMSLNELWVKSLSDVKPEEENIQHFEEGDVIEIDCGIPSVKLNGVEANDLVDIGSQFFDLEVGDNEIIISSDDNDITFEVIYNEKYL